MLFVILLCSGALEIETVTFVSPEDVTTNQELTLAQDFSQIFSRTERLLESDLESRSTQQIVIVPPKLVQIEQEEDKEIENEVKVKKGLQV